MTLLFGTGNPSKLDTMRRSLDGLGIEVLGLRDMDKPAPEVDESGKSPIENARIKALAYYRFYGVPVFSLDSGLFFEDVPDELQPGVHVRNVGGKHLSDDEMIEYYSSLARRFGGRLTARYKNALCLVMSEDEVYISMDESLWGKAFWLSDTPHSRSHKDGFPLDRLSVEIESGKYYFDLPVSVETEMNKGFRRFFENSLKERLL
ncbi:MAG: hypothetical protein K2J80_12985 [Oscillospiraceae bacterium]|nr:hypothetical protein [Oscillospiraceae bacterium]